MIIGLNPYIDQLQTMITSWESVVPALPNPHDMDGHGTSKDDVLTLFSDVRAKLDFLNQKDVDRFTWLVQSPILTSYFNSLGQILPVTVNPATFQVPSNLFNVLSPLFNINKLLTEMMPPVALSSRQIRDAQSKVATLESSVTAAKTIEASVKELEKVVIISSEIIEEKKKSATSSEENVNEIVKQVELVEAEISSIGATIEEIEAEADKTNDKFKVLNEDMSKATLQKDALFEEFESRRGSIEELLGSASKVALASSFKLARERTRLPQILWAAIFIVALSSAGLMSYHFAIHALDQKTVWTVTEIYTKVGYLTPFFILAYFAARQYGMMSRISIDYGFKESTALAYDGYRKDVASDKDLLLLLQVNAISHFGENPMHVLIAKRVSSEPDQGLAQRLLDAFGKVSPFLTRAKTD